MMQICRGIEIKLWRCRRKHLKLLTQLIWWCESKLWGACQMIGISNSINMVLYN